ncbi:hypothetical protein [Nocardioides sp. TF02-7]|uniref:hypothetical protein n=1 Tax=Nocardioides sp. TF02-7 TaxID=2917724 RepID=UPI001F06C7D7|nr:hypothetical protein [Nocardioides sp. TF02-7]UMG92276.1 hypothetical protein MF408_20585 [Nocardioides sp. TF02-7]
MHRKGWGERADLTTTPPGRTIEVPGGTQALSRAEGITVVHAGRRGTIPRPILLAAIVGKAAATALPGPERHYRDRALLCALVPDPFELVGQRLATLGRNEGGEPAQNAPRTSGYAARFQTRT